MLKKEFNKKDVQRARNLIAGNSSNSTGIQIGYKKEKINHKEGDVWTNSWFTWMGTGNKTGIGFSNRCHFDMKWENGRIIEMLCYYDNTTLNMEMAAQ